MWLYGRGLRRQRPARKRGSSDFDGAPCYACLLVSCMYWGLWRALEAGVGLRGGSRSSPGGASDVALLVLVPPLPRPFRCCARSWSL